MLFVILQKEFLESFLDARVVIKFNLGEISVIPANQTKCEAYRSLSAVVPL